MNVDNMTDDEPIDGQNQPNRHPTHTLKQKTEANQ